MEVDHGASVVALHLDSHEEVIRARDVLKRLGAFDMRYLGSVIITDL